MLVVYLDKFCIVLYTFRYVVLLNYVFYFYFIIITKLQILADPSKLSYFTNISYFTYVLQVNSDQGNENQMILGRKLSFFLFNQENTVLLVFSLIFT